MTTPPLFENKVESRQVLRERTRRLEEEMQKIIQVNMSISKGFTEVLAKYSLLKLAVKDIASIFLKEEEVARIVADLSLPDDIAFANLIKSKMTELLPSSRALPPQDPALEVIQ